jgi:hypothetical protein
MTRESFAQRLEQWGIFQSDILEKFRIAPNLSEEKQRIPAGFVARQENLYLIMGVVNL